MGKNPRRGPTPNWPAMTALTCSASFAALNAAISCKVEPEAAPVPVVGLRDKVRFGKYPQKETSSNH